MDNDELILKEKDGIKNLRNRVSDVLPPEHDDDIYLRRWLRARNHDVDKAEDMLRKHLQFMRVNGLDKIGEDYIPPKALDYFHTAKLGYDSEGSVVRCIHIGGCDIRGLALSVTKDDAFKFATYVIHSDVKQQKRDREGKISCEKQVYIFDLEGLSWTSIIHRTVVDRAFNLLKNYEANEPESLKVVYVLHAPSFFSFIYSWLKTFIPESILAKVELVPNEMIQQLLTKTIDPSILPASFGGTRTDEDGNPNCPCLYKMPLYSTVPENLRLCEQLKLLESDPSVKKTVVECGCVCKVRVVVKEPNSTIQWDFQTNYYDIRFGICYKEEENSEPSVIISPHRVESHIAPESGTFICLTSGLYDLIFDNSYSWLTKKELLYKVKVLKPSEDPYSS